MGNKLKPLILTISFLSFAVSSPAQWINMNAPVPWPIVSLGIEGGDLFAGSFYGRLIRSKNAGVTWKSIDSGLALPRIAAFAVKGSELFAASLGGGILISSDTGESWTNADSTLPNKTVHCMMVMGDTLYVGTDLGIFYTVDNGITWIDANGGTISYAIAALACRGATILAGGFHEVLLSTNNGSSWTRPDSNVITNSFPMAFLVSGGDVFCTTFMRGVFRSSDNGWTWTRTDSGITCDVTVSIVEANGSLFVGTHVGGVCRSTDRGESWFPINDGLSQLPYAFSLAVLDSFLIAATDSGVYRRPLSETTASIRSNASGLAPMGFKLAQNFPNPFNPTTTIVYELPTSSYVRLSVYDILGRVAAVLVNEKEAGGLYSVRFDASGLASGVYMYQLRAGASSQTRAMILLK